MDLGIRGEIALVLGGTQGLALSAAHHLSDAGAIVIMNGRDTDKGAQAVAELPNPGHLVQGDITIAADRAAIIAKTAALAGAPSILVTNSGGPPPGHSSNFNPQVLWSVGAMGKRLLSPSRWRGASCLVILVVSDFGRVIYMT